MTPMLSMSFNLHKGEFLKKPARREVKNMEFMAGMEGYSRRGSVSCQPTYGAQRSAGATAMMEVAVQSRMERLEGAW
jgi:hypothetical protein